MPGSQKQVVRYQKFMASFSRLPLMFVHVINLPEDKILYLSGTVGMIHRSKKGFTLIELLLVITLLSILVIFALQFYRQKAITARVNKASFEVQQVLAAAMTFNADFGNWPDNNSGLPTCTPPQTKTEQTFLQNYLPNGIIQSSVGANYCWGKIGKNGQLFWVALQSPNNNVDFANRVAAALPNAIATSDPNQLVNAPPCTSQACFVRAEITAQSGATGNGNLNIVAAGFCQSNKQSQNDKSVCDDTSVSSTGGASQAYTVTFNACKTGVTPRMYISPNFLNLPTNTHTGYSIMQIASNLPSCTTNPTDGKETCSVIFTATICKIDAEHNYKNYCAPIDIKTIGNNATIGGSYFITCDAESNASFESQKNGGAVI